jgi:curved DNA-binding protein CbpA
MLTDPYEVLGLKGDAGEEQIRQRYLTLVREHSPERDPKGFARIREAYDQLRDPVVSLQRRLFDLTATATFDSLLAAERERRLGRRIPVNVLLSLGE